MRILPDSAQGRQGRQEQLRRLAQERWLEVATAASAVVVILVCVTRAWPAPQQLAPLLAVPPALAGIGAASVKRPIAFGAASGIVAVIVAIAVHDALATASVVAVAVTAALSMAAAAHSAPRTRQIANVLSAAEAAQRAVLRPLPRRLGPLELGVVYLAAAADAHVGGDLYEVSETPHGIRLIVGDVRGKGLGAVEIAADVLGMYREVAHEVHTLAELARRIDAGLARRWGEYEEFVTAVFAEIDPAKGQLSIYSCGHPPPMLISADTVTVLDVPAPAPPLGLLRLGDGSGAGRTLPFKPNAQLLLYTDGVTEARDARQAFYPLDERLVVLGGEAGTDDDRTLLLELLREDLLRHAGAPLKDDAALLLVRAPATWPGPAKATALRLERRVRRVEQVPLAQPAVQRRGRRVVAPRMVAVGVLEAAEQLPLDRAELVGPVARPDAVVFVPDGDPPERVAEEHGLPRVRRVVVGPGVPEPPVEQHDVARIGGHLDRAVRVGPLHVAPRRPRYPVRQVAAGNDLEVSASRFGYVRQPVGKLDREPRPRVGLDLAVLPTAILMPLEPERALGGQLRMDVQMRVVDVHVPAQQRPHIGKRGRMVDQAGRLLAVRHGTELVHRAALLDPAVGHRIRVHLVQRVRIVADLVRCQRAADDQEPVAVELLAFRGRHRGHLLVLVCCA
jgi:serine phosphatase RsbU (regulator of sigma subunit)